MLSSEQILENATRGESVALEDWPRVLETVLGRLKEIVYNDFPMPKIPSLAHPSFTQESLDPEVVALTPPQSQAQGRIGSAGVKRDHDGEVKRAAEDVQPGIHEDEGDKGQDESSGTIDEEDVAMKDDEEEGPPNSQNSTKENDAPASQSQLQSQQTPPRQRASTMGRRETRAASWQTLEPGTLPPDLLSSYNISTHMLSTAFQHAPPYTIQRLAELVLQPKKHYRFLPQYLRALDRVVSVSSPASDFPLPALQAGTGGGFLTNGDAGAALNGVSGERDILGSDEALGGALLTPIPWLRKDVVVGNGGQRSSIGGQASPGGGGGEGELRSEGMETIDGPTGPGRIETVSVSVNGITSTAPQQPQQTSLLPSSAVGGSAALNPSPPSPSDQSDASTTSSNNPTTEAALRASGGVTQGELLRQEQEAGVVPVAQSTPRRNLMASGAVAVGRESAAEAIAASHAQMNNTASATADIAGEEREGVDVGMSDAPADAEHPVQSSETPHARGPGEIDMADTGPQRNNLSPDANKSGRLLPALDMEAAVGRRSLSPNPPAKEQEEKQPDTPHPDTIQSRRWKEENMNPGPSSSPTAARVARAAPAADAMAEQAAEDDSGQPGRAVDEVRQEVELMKEGMEEMEEEGVREEMQEGEDVVLADADGEEAMGEKARDEGGTLEKGGGNEMRGE